MSLWIDWVALRPRLSWGSVITCMGRLAGVAPTATAFPLRQAGGLNVRMAYTWNESETGRRLIQWADESLRLMRPSADERIYANFQTYEAGRGAAAVYGVNFSRLTGIKHKYDRE